MDIGPGSFVFSSGLMAGLRAERFESRTPKTFRAAGATRSKTWELLGLSSLEAEGTLASRLRRSVRTVAVLLGVARLVLTKAVEYQVCPDRAR
jgi:hypothetical protein